MQHEVSDFATILGQQKTHPRMSKAAACRAAYNWKHPVPISRRVVNKLRDSHCPRIQQWRSKNSMGDFTGPVKELDTRVAPKF